MDVPNTVRIVLLGKSGSGKSSLANTIFGEDAFKINHFDDSKTCFSQSETRSVRGRRLTLVDTSGFFDLGGSEEDLKPSMLSCMVKCAPGPHAFLLVLKVEKFTEQEEAVIAQISKHFSADVFRYAAVVFTHGDQLLEGMKIEEFVHENQGLSDLVRKCGDRCHIVDNKYWKNNRRDEYRSNRFQVEGLLGSVEKIVKENSGGFYSDERLRAVETAIQREEAHIRGSSRDMSQEEVREQAESRVFKKQVGKAPRTRLRWFVRFALVTGLFAIVLIKSKFVRMFISETFLGVRR